MRIFALYIPIYKLDYNNTNITWLFLAFLAIKKIRTNSTKD